MSALSSTQSRLLLIAASLVFVRFVVTPLLDYKATLRDELIVLTAQLDKSEVLLANRKKILELESKTREAEVTLNKIVPKVMSTETYRLFFQQRVNSFAASRGVVVSNFQWVLDAPLPGTFVLTDKARIQLTGKKSSLAYFHADLESEFGNAAVKELSFVYQPVDMGAGVSADASLNLLVDVVYQTPRSSEEPVAAGVGT